jgi:cytochrome P450
MTRPIDVYESLIDDTHNMGLRVISHVGYGYAIDSESTEKASTENQMNFLDTLRVLCDDMITLIVIPRPLLLLPIKNFRLIRQAYHDFGTRLHGLIQLGKGLQESSLEGMDNNILNLLVASSVESGKARPLTDKEILGNSFGLLVAGVETRYEAF